MCSKSLLILSLILISSPLPAVSDFVCVKLSTNEIDLNHPLVVFLWNWFRHAIRHTIYTVCLYCMHVCVRRTYIRLRRLHSMSTLFACPLIALVVRLSRYFILLYPSSSPAGPLYYVQYGVSELVPKLSQSIFDFPSHFIQTMDKYD